MNLHGRYTLVNGLNLYFEEHGAGGVPLVLLHGGLSTIQASFGTVLPAFAKTRSALTSALRGYHDINLRAMRLLASGGALSTASCCSHLTKPLFLEMIERAAADSGRRMALREIIGQPMDHPEILTIPETGYIKGAILEAMDAPAGG